MKCNAHLNNTFYSYFRVHGKTQPRVFFHVRKGRVDAKRGVLQYIFFYFFMLAHPSFDHMRMRSTHA